MFYLILFLFSLHCNTTTVTSFCSIHVAHNMSLHFRRKSPLLLLFLKLLSFLSLSNGFVDYFHIQVMTPVLKNLIRLRVVTRSLLRPKWQFNLPRSFRLSLVQFGASNKYRTAADGKWQGCLSNWRLMVWGTDLTWLDPNIHRSLRVSLDCLQLSAFLKLLNLHTNMSKFQISHTSAAYKITAPSAKQKAT